MALFQQGDDLAAQGCEIEGRACQMQAISRAGLLCQIDALKRRADIDDQDPLLDTIIAGIKGLVGTAAFAREDDQGDDDEPAVIGFGEPEERS